MTDSMKKIKPGQLLLIAEDSDDDYEITVHALNKKSKLDNPVARVESGSELLDYLFKKGDYEHKTGWQLPKIILLDLNMPGVDGRTALREIRDSDFHKCIPIIVLTTSTAEQDIEACYRDGANAYIQKPVNLDKFIQAIQKFKEDWFDVTPLNGHPE